MNHSRKDIAEWLERRYGIKTKKLDHSLYDWKWIPKTQKDITIALEQKWELTAAEDIDTIYVRRKK